MRKLLVAAAFAVFGTLGLLALSAASASAAEPTKPPVMHCYQIGGHGTPYMCTAG